MAADWTNTVPALTSSGPVNVLAPVKVTRPAPFLVSDRAPPTSANDAIVTSVTASIVELAVSVPEPVKVNAPLSVASPITTLPPSDHGAAIERDAVPVLESVPPFNAAEPPRAPSAPIRSRPAVRVVPAWAFAVVSVSVAAPALARLNPPLTFAIETSLSSVTVLSPSTLTPLENVSAPVSIASPSTTSPLKATGFTSSRAVELALESRPPASVTVPAVPSASSASSRSRPSVSVVPPE